MNSIEEKLWNYLDGSCSPEEHEAISQLIATDQTYQQKYQELLAFNQELENMELDAPPMAFTYNVMEAIRTEEASKPLKANIDHRIIKAIAAFFIGTIAVLLIIALANSHADNVHETVQIPVKVHLPALTNYISAPVMKSFLFFDVVLALFLFDGYLRKKHTTVS
jgi:anti-sigma factor RsiW